MDEILEKLLKELYPVSDSEKEDIWKKIVLQLD